jgi:amino acid adenylation domain-containing protein
VLTGLSEATARFPERPALSGSGRTLTYRALDCHANQYATCVAQHRQSTDTMVLVALEDRAELITAMIGIFRGAGVFVPVDPSWPDERLRAVLRQVSPRLAVVDRPAMARLVPLMASLGLDPVLVSRDPATGSAARPDGEAVLDPGRLPVDPPGVAVDPDALRYVYFTSGSTGQPKGIAGRLSALEHFVRWEARAFDLREGCRVSQLITPTFDAFFRDTLVPLTLGGVVCIPPRRTAEIEIGDLLDWIDRERIELIHCVPSLFKVLLDGQPTPDRFPALRHILLSGEAIAPATVRRWREIFGDRIALVNFYGATETTMIRFFHRISAADVTRGIIPIGTPIDDTEFLLVDEDGAACAPGATGELYVRTPHRSLGYYGNPEATAQVFVPNPLTGDLGDIVYRTGDLCRLNAHGQLEFLGRRDLQVKINGIRVDLAEVRNTILGFPGLRDCAVVMKPLGRSRGSLIVKDAEAPPADAPAPRMVAYVVGGGETVDPGLRAFLAARLPGHMIPARIVPLAALPLNANGKLDADALPHPDRFRAERSGRYVPPRSESERRIAAVWQDILGLDRVGVHDNFFDLGGDSLLALRAANRLRRACARELTVGDLFERGTIAALQEHLHTRPALEAPAGTARLRQPPDRYHPLSLAQQGLLFLWKLDPDNPYYTAQGVLTFTGPLRLEALQEAWAAVLRRHQALCARFLFREGVPAQEFVEPGVIDLAPTDLAPGVDPLASLRAIAGQWAAEPFDLERGPILRSRLFRTSDREHFLLLTVHEIAHDLWSVGVLIRDLAESYQRALAGQSAELPCLPVRFSDWVAWEASHITRARLGPEEAFWRGQLAGPLPVLDLPFDRPRPDAPTYRGASRTVWVDAELTRRLVALSQAHRATLFMTLLSAFQSLLRIYSGQTDVIVGAPLANRHLEAAERLVGFFLNMLPLRAHFDDDPTFEDLLARNRTTVTGAMGSAAYPFLWMLEWADARRDPRVTPVFQVMFNMLSFADEPVTAGDVTIAYRGLDTGYTKYDLSLYAQERAGRIQLTLAYQVDLFEDATVDRLLKNLVVLLGSVADAPAARISALTCVAAEEATALVAGFNRTERPYPLDASIPELFERQAVATPEAPAYLCRHHALSFRELNERANRLAHHLIARGIGPGTRVGVCLDRSFDLVVSLLAVLKAGGTYVGLDPAHPVLRRREMLAQVGAGTLLCASPHEAVPAFGGDTILLDVEGPAIAARSGATPVARAASDGLLNIVYTSSSTGTPKGVLIPMRAALNRLHWMWEAYPFEAGDVALLQKPCTLVATFWELFGALLKGHPTVILTLEEVLDSRLRWRRIVDARVTRLAASPAFLAGVLDEAERHPEDRAALRLVTTSAEPIAPAMVRRWHRVFPGVPLLNLYGASECSSNATVYDTAALPATAARVPVGRPIANTRAYVLDEHGKPVPIGVVGELCVAGECVAAGYLHRPELTQERFVPNPFADGPYRRLYRTGDLARVRADGVIELVGRADLQVKIRGFRVDPGEVEAVLETHPAVRRCVVVPAAPGQPPGSTLVAYVVLAEPARPSALRDFMRLRLPDYMVPAHYVVLDALPLTAAGKVDRRQLPPLDATALEPAPEYTAPRTSVEWMLADVWSAYLGAGPVGIHEEFFALGGHSLLATQMIAYVTDLLGVDLPLQRFLSGPTVAGLADALANILGSSERAAAIGREYRAFRDALREDAPPAGPDVTDAGGLAGSAGAPDHGVAAPRRLTRDERRAFAARLGGLGLRARGHGRIPRRPPATPAPLSYPQQRIWLLQQMEPESALYNLAKVVHLRGDLDVDALRASLEALVRRHEILRTTYAAPGGQPCQVVHPPYAIPLPPTDLGALPPAAREAELGRLAVAAGRRPFDLSGDPMLRASLVRLGPREHALLLGWHHITSDGWSLGVRFADISERYNALVEGRARPDAEPALQYADFATWQRATLTDERLAPHRAYWRHALAGAPARLELPTDRPRPAVQTYRGATLPVRFTGELSARLRHFCQRERLTPYMALLAGFLCLLRQYSGQDDLVVGSPIANRQDTEVESLIGIFMNMLPIRCHLSGGQSVRDLLRQVEARTLDAYAHQELPFEEIVAAVRPDRTATHAPIFQVMLNVLNLPRADLALSGLDCRVDDVDLGLARYDLSLFLADDDHTIGGRVEFSTDLFDRATVARMMDHLPRLLAEMLADPTRRVADLATLGPDEARTILVEWNRTTAPVPEDVRVDQLVDAQAAATPEATAIVFRNQRTSYAALRRRARALAAELGRAGVVPGERIGLLLERSVEMVVAMLAVSRAGGAYVPLDPAFPRERLQAMIADAGMTRVLTAPSPGAAGHTPDARLVSVGQLGLGGSRAPDTGTGAPEASARLAYVMFTSGSTGRPKGVAVSHRALVNFLGAMRRCPGIAARDVVLAHTTVTFDIAQLELLLPLTCGASVVLLDGEASRDARAIVRALVKHGVTLLQATPATWRLIRGLGWEGKPDLTMLIGGEAFDLELARDLAPRGAGLWNMYGPTETTVWSAVERLDPDASLVSVGRPIANTAIYVVTPDLKAQAPGVVGEILIGGAGVAEGYLNRPDETRERFIPDPFSAEPSRRVYRTGDRGRFLADGRLIVLGRTDSQIKLRGFRIELGEIEAALARHPAVRQAIAVLQRGTGPDDAAVVAYVRLEPGQAASGEALRDSLATVLPPYMLPAAVVVVDAVPLTSSGKADREALARIDPSRRKGPGAPEPPASDTERAIAGIFGRVLEKATIGATDDFFDLGGQSIKAIMVLARIEEALGVAIPLGRFFEQPTVRDLARRVDAGRPHPPGRHADRALDGIVAGVGPDG